MRHDLLRQGLGGERSGHGQDAHGTGRLGGFTLIELLVVIAVIIIMLSVALPAVRSMMRNNAQSQAINEIRAYLSTARSVAIAQHRQAGVIFFEETAANAPPANHAFGQTAMQIILEDPSQYPVPGAVYISAGVPAPGYTGFVYYIRDRQYLPNGIQAAVLNDSTSSQVTSGYSNSSTSNTSRVILFDANGQLVLRNGIARSIQTSTFDVGYPKAYADWNIATMDTSGSNLSLGVSSPGVLVFSMKDYQAQTFADDQARATWVQQHSDVLIINAYTGNILR